MSGTLLGADAALAGQRAIAARIGHPSGRFEPFERAEVEQSIPERFERLVERHPERLAVRTRRHALTYRALNEAANRVAHAILGLDGERPEPVALLFGNDAPFVSASLGLLKAGKVQVPLDRTFPASRLAYMLDQSRARVIVTDGVGRALAEELAGTRHRVVDVDELGGEPAANPGLPLSPRAWAAINFTSGSTGTPKGIVHEHRAILHNVMRLANAFGFCGDDRMAFLRAATVPPLYALLVGATYHPMDADVEDVADLAARLAQEDVTVFRGAVSAFRALVDTLRGDERLPHLRLVMVFGEPAYPTDVERYRRHFAPGCVFASSLGTRETGDYAYYLVDRTGPLPAGVVPGGYPMEEMDVLLLDDDGRPVAEGEPGELAVRTAYAAVGYWDRPDLTAAAFLPDPAGGDRRIYRTGDMGRRLPDGCLLHQGRRDFQVKIRGYRVDVGEVETALLQVEGVKSAVVAGREVAPGDRRLVAYLVPNGRALPPVTELRRALAARFPEYMVPSAFVTLDALPFTATGKIDRRALPAPGPARPSLATPFSEPRTPLEAALAGIFAETLGVAGVGADDSFFDLGGQSLLALRLVTEIDRRFGKRLPLAGLLEAPSPRALAAILGQDGWTPAWSSVVAIQPRGSRPPLFCVPGHSGTILCFQGLSRLLGPEQPMFGLEPRGLDGRHEPHESIEAMAAAYLEEIQAFQPEGPYCLAGYCFGGLVAYEMARRLRAKGHAVALLALFDTLAPAGRECVGGPPRSSRRLARAGARLRVEYRNLAALSGRERMGYLRARLDQVAARLASAAGRRAPGESDPLIERVARAQSRAARDYRADPYDGPMVVYKARHPLTAHLVDPDLGWRPLVADGLDVRLVVSAGGSVIQDPAGAQAVASDLRDRIPPG